MYDVGDVYPARVEVRDSSGTLVAASSVSFTFTLPDGTTQQVTPTSESVGVYTYDFAIEQYGLHRFAAVATGPAYVVSDAFNAVDATWPAFVGLAEVKQHLNIAAGDTTHDEELRAFVLSACEVVESIVGVVARRGVTEKHSGGSGGIALDHPPAISVTSVTENGTVVDPGGYSLSAGGGVLRRVSGYRSACWAAGVDNITVVYEAGRAAAPWSVLDATRELIRVNWRPQQGGNYSPFDGGRSDDFGVAAGQVRLGFFVPNTVMQRLNPHARGPLVA